MSGGGKGKSTSTSTQAIPLELKPLANAYASKAMDLGSQGYNPYSGDRFEDLNSTQLQGLEMMKQRATGGSQTVNNAESALNQIIQGGNTNPYLDQMVKRPRLQRQCLVAAPMPWPRSQTTGAWRRTTCCSPPRLAGSSAV